MQRSDILKVMNLVITTKGRTPIEGEDQNTRDANYRSLDFSETALRIEMQIGRELVFDAATMRQITTIRDVIDFFEEATTENG